MKQANSPAPTPSQEALPTQVDVKIHALHASGSVLADASVNLNGCFAIRGVKVVQGSSGPFVSMPSYKGSLPNILAILDGQTLARRSVIAEILKQSGRGQDFLNNPQMFIESAAQIIRDACYSLAIDGISYKKLYGTEYYVQEIFDSAELIANLDRNAVPVDRSVYDYIVYDSAVESEFALALDDDPDVKMFFKLPDHFKIDTPIGTYNPDWAVYVEVDGMKKLYFILETKGSTSELNLRRREALKIRCGKAHFQAIGSGAELHTATRWKDFKMHNT